MSPGVIDDLWSAVRDRFRRAWQNVVADTERLRDPITIGPQHVVLVGPVALPTVSPPKRAVWDDRGWTSRAHVQGQVYEGMYQVKRSHRNGAAQLRQFPGYIVQRPWPGTITAYVADPPKEIRAHPKGPCFQLTQPPWFRLHWVHPAGTVDDAILYVERVLAEALRNHSPRSRMN